MLRWFWRPAPESAEAANGLGAALHNEIRIEGGRVKDSNFHTYRSLRIHEMPEVEVHIVPSGEAPTAPGVARASAQAAFIAALKVAFSQIAVSMSGSRWTGRPARPKASASDIVSWGMSSGARSCST